MDGAHPELLALTALIILGCGAMAIRAGRLGDRRRASRWTAGGLGVFALYTGLLVLVSTSARPVALARGETRRFCGFYLDCHVGVAVVDDQTGPAAEDGRLRHVVTVEMRSDARRATIGVTGVRAELVAADGRRYQAASADVAGLEERLPAGGSYRRELVFDVPPDTGPLVLEVSAGRWVDRLIERLIVGDEDSFLHPPITLALGPAA